MRHLHYNVHRKPEYSGNIVGSFDLDTTRSIVYILSTKFSFILDININY